MLQTQGRFLKVDRSQQIEGTMEPKEQHKSEFSFCFIYSRLSTGEATIQETPTGAYKKHPKTNSLSLAKGLRMGQPNKGKPTKWF